jgi:uncharacterized protein YukE
MTTIHMDTEHVRETARLLDQWAADMDSKGTGLRAALGELSGAWRSTKAESFQNNFTNWLRNYESEVEQLLNLALRVSREAEQWETIDGQGATDFHKELEKCLKLWPEIDGLGVAGEGYSILQYMLTHLNKNIKSLGPLFDIPSAILSYFDDKDPDHARAMVSSFVETFGPYSLLLIPGLGEAALGVYEGAMLINSVVQVGANVQVLADKTWADTNLSSPEFFPLYDELGVTTQNFYENAERIDIDNIPKDIGRAVYDFAIRPYADAISAEYNHPSVENMLHLGAITAGGPMVGFALDPSAQQAAAGDVLAIGNDTANVVIRAWQLPNTYADHQLVYGIAQVDKLASQLPIPENWKSVVNQSSIDIIHTINEKPSYFDLIHLAKPREY